MVSGAGRALVLCLFLPGLARSQVAALPCDADSAFHRLDFWVGQWIVSSGGVPAGTDHVEKILNGCAVTERWKSANGNEGRSLFYYVAATQTWHQVWVTANATRRGGVKEKRLIAVFPDGGVRFQGEIPLPGGGTYLDRTTLTPLSGGRVRQVIEVSRDGASWQTTFDAVYAPAPAAASPDSG
jgi:hypothetical protein